MFLLYHKYNDGSGVSFVGVLEIKAEADVMRQACMRGWTQYDLFIEEVRLLGLQDDPVMERKIEPYGKGE